MTYKPTSREQQIFKMYLSCCQCGLEGSAINLIKSITKTSDTYFQEIKIRYNELFDAIKNGNLDLIKFYKVFGEPDSKGVYFLRHGYSDFYKIGVTSNISKRFISLQASNPIELTLLSFVQPSYGKEFERIMHEYLKEYNHHYEWYKIPNQLAALIIEKIGNKNHM